MASRCYRAAVRISLCGRVTLGGLNGEHIVIGRPQVQLCLAILVLERHRAVTRDELAHALWGDDLGRHWQGALRGVIGRVREALTSAGADTHDPLPPSTRVVQLDLGSSAITVDIEVARQQVLEAEERLRQGDASEAASLAGEATNALAADFLVAVDRPWADDRRHDVQTLRRRAERLRARALLANGDPSSAVEQLRRLLLDDPYDEHGHVLLIEALEKSGDRVRAIAAYERSVEVLQTDLGVRPSDALRSTGERLFAWADAGPNDTNDTNDTKEGNQPARDAHRGEGDAPWIASTELFFGRETEVGGIVEAVMAPRSATGVEVIVLEGEPGVGKTTLAREVARRVATAGGRVLWGTCSPHGEIPYEPISQALDQALGDPAAAADLDDLCRDLAHVAPSLPHPPEGVPADRTRLFAAVAEAFRRLCIGPTLWVVDDLQWATADTRALLDHVAGALAERPVLVLAPCRERPADTARMLESLSRRGSLQVLSLDGLDVAAVQDWLAQAAVNDRPGLATDVHDRTGGNALFVGHLIRAAQQVDHQLDPSLVPDELTTLLTQRLDSLSSDELLVVSAVAVADEFADLALVGEIVSLHGPELLTATDRLSAAGLLVDRNERLAVRHAVVADAVIAHLGPSRKAWLHLRAAQGLESRSRRRGFAAELVRHYSEAGPDHVDVARAWTLRAALEALDQVAWARAADLANRLIAAPGSDPGERAGALIVLGRARRGLGDGPGGEDALREAVSLARTHGLQRQFGEAALALAGGGGRSSADPARLRWVPLLEEALTFLDDSDSDQHLRISLLGALSLSLLLTDRDEERVTYGRSSLEAARRSGDGQLLARALLDHRYTLSAAELERRMAETDEALELGRREHLPEVVVAALLDRHEDLLVAGRRSEAAAVLAEAHEQVRRHPDAYWAWAVSTWGTMSMLLDGELDEAEAAALRSVDLAPDPEVGFACYGVNLVAVRAFQGRVAETIEMLHAATAGNPFIPCYRAVLAFALAESGHLDQAANELAHFSTDHFQGVSHNTNRPLTLAMLAEVVVAVGDADAAVHLRPLLEPYDGCHIVLNSYGGGGTMWGPASAQLAGLARCTGDHERATAWYASAIEQCERLGDRSFLARLQR